MSSRFIRNNNQPQEPRRLALVDADVNLHHTLREHATNADPAWRVDSYTNGADALKGVASTPPQVVLMDIGLPGTTGIECAQEMKFQFPRLPVVMLTSRAQPELVLSALRAGARGYVIKANSLTHLVPLINKAVAGGMALCLKAEHLLMEAMQRAVAIPTEWGLTRREEEVLLCLCRHLSNKEMASALGLSAETVHVHLLRAFKKLGVHDRQAAIHKLNQKCLGGGKMVRRDLGDVTHFNPSAMLQCEWRRSSM